MRRIGDKGRSKRRFALWVFATFLCLPNVPTFARSAGKDSVSLRMDGPAVDAKAAQRLSPDAVGDLLLAPGHPPVTRVRIGPEFMVPYPPGVKIPERFELHLRPVRSREAGFCERVIAIVHLKAVDRLVDGTISPSRPEKLETKAGYQWAGKGKNQTDGCEPETLVLVPKAEDKANALKLVRILALAQARAKHRPDLPYPAFVEDMVGPRMLEHQRESPDDDPIEWEVFTDPRKALLAVPIHAVSDAGPSSGSYSDILTEGDKASMTPNTHAVTLFAGGEWSIGMILAGDRIVMMRIKRAFPPPF